MKRNIVISVLAALLIFIAYYIYKYRYIYLGMKNSENWVFPITGTVVITSHFGARKNPITGAQEGHNGVDIAGPGIAGKEILCPFAGTVESVYSNNLGGNQVIIRHANGYKTGYAHMQRSIVKIGQVLKQLDVIGYVGNTGQSTGPHLHFTLRDAQGNLIDPEKFYNS